MHISDCIVNEARALDLHLKLNSIQYSLLVDALARVYQAGMMDSYTGLVERVKEVRKKGDIRL
jgi:hypothetical protein